METTLDNRVIELVISSEFARKIGFKSKKIERPIYVKKNVNRTFNKDGLIEYTVEANIYYQRYKEKIEIDMIEEQK